MTETDLGLDDGSTLHVYAQETGRLAVFWLHGTPNIGLPPEPLFADAARLGLRWIGYDRPGYGGSTPRLGRDVASAAYDVARIADRLGVDRFAVVGHSGGGPHALACAALLPDRVLAAVSIAGLAPFDAAGLDWFAGMADSNVREYTTAANEPEELTAHLVRIAAEIRANPVSHVSTLSPEMPEVDRRIVADTGIRALLAQNYAEALRESADGWIDDALAFCAPWGFDLTEIKVPVLLWHGQNDVFSPVAHTRWLADQIPGANLSIRPNAAHFAAIVVMPDVLSWLIRAA